MTTSKKAGAQQELIPTANHKRINRLGARNNLRLAMVLKDRLGWIKQTGATKTLFARIAAEEIGVAIHETNVSAACRALAIEWPNGSPQRKAAAKRLTPGNQRALYDELTDELYQIGQELGRIASGVQLIAIDLGDYPQIAHDLEAIAQRAARSAREHRRFATASAG